MLSLLLLSMLMLSPSQQAETMTVSVRLFAGERVTSLTMRSPDSRLLLFDQDTDNLIARVPSGSSLDVERRDQVVRLRWEGGGALIRHVRIESEDAMLPVDASGVRRSYRGTINVSPHTSGALLVVNRVGLEAYVASVLPSEYPFTELEGAKAQAVASRTYALAASRKFGSAYDLSDDVASQVYRGAGSETALSRQAAWETRGEVLLHDGSLIEAVYSASNGGHTADNTTIWQGEEAGYLTAKPDPFDRDERYDRWSADLDADRLHEVLGRSLDARVTGVAVAEVSSEGRATAIETDGSPRGRMRAGEFRSLVNAAFGENTLRSTFFEMRRRGDAYEISGRGFGHGVGLSQIGTRNRARAGHSYRDILAFYFDRTEITALDQGEQPPEWLADRQVAPTSSTAIRTEESPPIGSSEASGSSRPERSREPKIWHNRTGKRRVGW